MQTTKWRGIHFVCTSSILYTTIIFLAIGAPAQVDLSREAEWAVSERGPHHRVWDQVVPETNRLGQVTLRTLSSYTELQTGLHFWDGQWVESRPALRLTADGAAATESAHKVRFAANANSVNAVEVVTPDGKRLRSRVAGISYSDTSTGKAVWVSQTKDSIGLLVGEDQVLYTNAFDTVVGDIHYVVGRAGLEQNIVWREMLPSPANYGLIPESTWVQVLTEFFDAPEPVRKLEPSGFDELLSFGDMAIPRGRGFAIGADAPAADSVAVAKQWTVIDGRTFLVEEVPYVEVAERLDVLLHKKGGASIQPSRRGPAKSMIAALDAVVPKRASSGRAGKMVLAQLDVNERPGFLLDYTLLTAQTNFTFAANTNYYVSGLVNLSGTTTIDGGTIIKFTNHTSAKISMSGPLVCRTEPYRPAVLTSKDDNTVGETITGSTGNPTNYNGGTYLYSSVSDTNNAIQYLRLSYAGTGLAFDGLTNGVWHCQFWKCKNGIDSYNQKEVRLYNVLMAGSSNAIVNSTNVRGQHLTVDICSNLVSATGASLFLTNSLLTAVAATGVGSPTYDHVVTAASGSGVYTNVGAASYYLVADSANRNAGGIGLNAALTTDLKTKTTYPPVVISTNITGVTVLSPQAGRDTDAPDLGYHYEPLDFVVSARTVTTSLTLTNGVALGTYGTSAQSGLALNSGSLTSVGSPTGWNWIARYNTVQEQSTTSWSASTVGASIKRVVGSVVVRAQFTGWSLLGGSGDHYSDAAGRAGASPQAPAFSHSRFGGGKFTIGSNNGLTPASGWIAATNCLWERVTLSLTDNQSDPQWYLYNNCFHGGWLDYSADSTNLALRACDNLFEKTKITGAATTTGDYSSYVTNQNRLSPNGAHDVILTNNPVFSTSFLGRYYYPTNDGMLSGLINAGSVTNAAQVGLYHFTTTTDQTQEGTSRVDIGYHYLAVGSDGSPSDTDGDGIPDYVEDKDGDGVVGAGESDWQDYYNGSLPILIKVSGDNQLAPVGSFLPAPLTIRVTLTNGVALTNAPVSFDVGAGVCQVAAATNGALTATLTLRTDAGGYAAAWVFVPTNAPATNTIGVSAQSSTNTVQDSFTCVALALAKGINLGGEAVAIEGNQWLSYTQALAGGLSVSNARTEFRSVTNLAPAADSGVSNLLQTFVVGERLPPLAQQATNNTQFQTTKVGTIYDIVCSITNMPPGYMVTNGVQLYRAWYLDGGNTILRNTNYPCTMFYTYGPPIPRYQSKNLNRLNYLINHKHGDSADIQNALWTLLDMAPLPYYVITTNFTTMTNEAYLYGGSFVPTNGQAALVAFDTGITNGQALAIEVTNLVAGFTLTQTMPNGAYHSYLWLAENQADHVRSLDVKSQGATVATNVGDLSLQHWAKYGPYTANVTNGVLTLDVISPVRGDPLLMGLGLYTPAPAGQPLSVSIVSPTNGHNLLAREALTLGASVSTPTNLAWVQFFESTNGVSSNSVGLAVSPGTNGLYEAEWTPVFGGTYTLTALAGDARGSNAVSPSVTVNVRSRPTVTITNPVTLAVLGPAPTNLTLQANASVTGASITNVAYYQGTNFIGAATTGPSYSLTWNNVTAGNYTLTAKATDNTGATAASHPVSINVIVSNQPPTVEAGSNMIIRRPNAALLAGIVTDDGLPLGTNVTLWWTNLSRPSGATVTFASTNQAVTLATFSHLGFYTNRLTASDGEFTVADEMTVEVLETNLPPTVNAGANQTVTNALVAQLNGSAADDGQPSASALAMNWQLVAGPGLATFANSALTNTLVLFEKAGTYQLALSACDGEFTTSSIVSITATLATNVVEYGATGYLYRIVGDQEAETSTFYTTNSNFDDSTWTNGQAAFGNVRDTNFDCYVNSTNYVKTLWDDDPVTMNDLIWSNLLLRRRFVVPEGTTNLSMGFTVDNQSWVYLNGSILTDTNADFYQYNDYLGYWEFYTSEESHQGVFYHAVCPRYDDLRLENISTNLWHVGTNLVAVRVQNQGGPCFFDLRFGLNAQGLYDHTNQPPTAIVGRNQFVITNTLLQLSGIVSDDGLVEAIWEVGEGPGNVYFYWDGRVLTNSFVQKVNRYGYVNVIAAFSTNGEYKVHLGAYDGQLGATNDVTVIVRSDTTAPPTVSITSPTNAAVFPADVDIPVLAATTNVTGVITNFEFIATTTNGTFLIGQTTNAPFGISWRPGFSGTYELSAYAFDDGGRVGIAPPITIEVLPFTIGNQSPQANTDQPTVLANSVNNILYLLRNDTDPDGDALTITEVIPAGKAQIVAGGKAVSYTPPNKQGYPADGFSYRISDGRGGTSLGGVLVNVYASPAPSVAIVAPASAGGSYTTNAGAVVTITASVAPSAFITRVEFIRDEFVLGVVTNGVNGQFTLNWPATFKGCQCGITATAYDMFGQVGTSDPIYLTATNPPGVGESISSLMTYTGASGVSLFTNGVVIQEGFFGLYGQAYHSLGSNVVWQLDVKDTDGNLIRTVTNSTVAIASASTSNLLANCDFTTLENGVYDLSLTVTGGYFETNMPVRFVLDSNLKLGQFSFSQQDLVIPVSGIPLTVVRTYNSLHPRRGDFGYGWTYAINDLDVVMDEQRDLVEGWSLDNGAAATAYFSQRVAGERDLTLTLPDGQRTTFYFYLDGPMSCTGSGNDGYCFKARWQAAPGVTWGLEAQGNNTLNAVMSAFGSGQPYWEAGVPGLPMDYFDFRGFVLTNRDGTQYYLDREDLGGYLVLGASGTNYYPVQAWGEPHLTRIVQRSGDTIRIGPEAIWHTNPTNGETRRIVFQRNADGLLTGISDPNGLDADGTTNGPLAVKYEYDNQDNLIRVLQLVDRGTGSYVTNSFSYTNGVFPHYITSIYNSRGIPVARNLYDEAGKLVGVMDAAGRTNVFEHDLSGRRETHYDRNGNPTTYRYDTRGNVTETVDALNHTNRFLYDANGYLTNSVDALGHVTVYTNDADGNVLSVTVPYPAGAEPDDYTTRYTYNEFGEQTSVRLATGGVITNVFDPNTGVLLAIKDGNGNVISATTYDANGLPATETDHFGALKYAYDAMGNLAYMTNSLGKVVSSLYDGNGNLTNLVDGTSTTAVTYDALNRETFASYGNNITVNYGFEDEGDWSSVDGPTLGHMERKMDDQGRLAGWETANGSTPGFAYDVNGRLEYETNSIGVATRSAYNAVGWLTASTNLATGAWSVYDYDAAGQRIGLTNALGFATRYGYYPSGSLKAMTNALGTNWLYSDAAGTCAACGNAVSVTDPFGRVTESIASPYGLPISTVWRFGSLVSSNHTEYLAGLTTEEQEAQEYPVANTDEGGRTRRYEYTDLGQLYRATDLSGATWWTNQFDTNSGALTNVLSPTSESLAYVYDDLDNVKALGFGDGNWLTNFYNAENRLSGVRLPSGVAVTNHYDFAGRLTNRSSTIGETASFTFNGNDAVTVMTDNTGSTTNLYDAAGRLWGIDYPSGTSVRYELDLLDRIIGITNKATAGGTAYVTRYQYDALGNVTNVVDPFNGNTGFEYDRVGRRTKRTLPNNVVTEWQYDWRDRVTNITHKANGGSTLASFTYWRNPGGEPNKIAREDGSYVELKYDAALRLTNEVYKTSGGSMVEEISYGYDAAGSRTRLVKGGVTYTNSVSGGYQINVVKNAATGNTTNSYAYDAGGRVTSINRDGAILNLGYNTADQVQAVTNGANWVTYAHDASGRRTFSTNNTSVRKFLVSPTPGTDLESPLLIANASGTVKQGYVYLGDDPVLRYDAGGSVRYYLEDAMGSIAALTDGSGTSATATFNYDGFGNIRSQSGSTSAPTDTGGDFRFHGAWLEEGSGLYNMRAREYDARMGRFTSRDPDEGEFGLAETLNSYGFANLNPFIYVDPSGKTTLIEINIVSLIQNSLAVMRQVGTAYAKKRIKSSIFDAFINVASAQLGQLSPEYGAFLKVLRAADIDEAAVNLEKKLLGAVCKVPAVQDSIYMEPSINGKGDAIHDGLSCREYEGKKSATSYFKRGNGRPDFILSSTPPTKVKGREAILVGEIKVSGSRFYKNYVKPGGKKKQLDAICNFAGSHVATDTAVFLTVWKGNKSQWDALKRELLYESVKRHTMLILYSATKK